MKVIFDASALLILLNKEPGYLVVKEYVSQAIISAINFSETLTVLMNIGIPQEDAVKLSTSIITEIIPFDSNQAILCASLRTITKQYGLSIGDRACLALAKYKNLPVITADKVWQQLNLPLDIILAR